MNRGIAIRVRYAGPTNARGSRWIATADHPIGRQTIAYVAEGIEGAEHAAQALVNRWNADDLKHHGSGAAPRRIVAAGHLPDGAYAFVVCYIVAEPVVGPEDTSDVVDALDSAIDDLRYALKQGAYADDETTARANLARWEALRDRLTA